MPTDAYGVTYPSSLDAPDGAAQMMQLVASFSSRLVQEVADQADRDSRFADAPSGLLVVTTQAPWTIWLRSGTTWLKIYYDTGWVTTGFSTSTGWDIATSQGTRGRNKNGTIEINVDAVRSGGDLNGGSDGNIADSQVCTIPPSLAPGVRARNMQARYAGSAQAYVNTAGGVMLTSVGPNLTLSSGSGILLSATYLEG